MEEAESAKALRQEQGMFQDQRGGHGGRSEQRKVGDDDGKAGGKQITRDFEDWSEELPVSS